MKPKIHEMAFCVFLCYISRHIFNLESYCSANCEVVGKHEINAGY